MPFNTALSGIRAASKDLSITGNNIANASTTGFKSSRAEFGDLYASTVLGSSANATGNGVRLQDVAQNFKEGNITFTESSLDMAINGSGFFMVNIDGDNLYTRAGTFGLDNEGYIINNAGGRLQGFPANSAGSITNLRGDLRVQTSNLSPRQTSQVESVYNFDASQPAIDAVATPFDPNDETTYTAASSMNVYDSLGTPHVMTQYFVRQPYDPADPATLNHWQMHVRIDDRDVGGTDPDNPTLATYDIYFGDDGQLDMNRTDDILISNWTPVDAEGNEIGAMPPDPAGTTAIPEPPTTSNFVLDITGSTMFNDDFGEYSVHQNGYTTGRLSSLTINDEGLIFARFTNGQSQSLGQIVLANFPNEQGLTPRGDTMWSQSMDSGAPSVGIPGTSDLGAIQSGALEESNVDLSEQLVNLIVAQRNFQASAKTIETADQTTQTIINLR